MCAGTPPEPPGTVRIGRRRLGVGQPVYLIAEAGVNHNGRVDLAHRMIKAAAVAGVDAVKFQVFRPEALAAACAPKPRYMMETAPAGGSQRDLLTPLALDPAAWADLKAHAEALRLEFLATPFDPDSLELLKGLGVRALKMASTELTNLPLLRQAAATDLPLLLSTGTCTLAEVRSALDLVGRYNVVLLHCVSSYPTAEEDANLRAIATLREAFEVPVGFSDHTCGLEASALAVAVGASVLEKHFTLNRQWPGPDHRFSLTPEYLAEWVRRVRRTEQMLGDGSKKALECELDVKRSARRSVVALVDVPAGTLLTPAMLGTKRPGTGIEPGQIDRLVGRRTLVAIPKDTPLTWAMLEAKASDGRKAFGRPEAA